MKYCNPIELNPFGASGRSDIGLTVVHQDGDRARLCDVHEKLLQGRFVQGCSEVAGRDDDDVRGSRLGCLISKMGKEFFVGSCTTVDRGILRTSRAYSIVCLVEPDPAPAMMGR